MIRLLSFVVDVGVKIPKTVIDGDKPRPPFRSEDVARQKAGVTEAGIPVALLFIVLHLQDLRNLRRLHHA